MQNGEYAARNALLEELMRMQEEMETSLLPQFIEPILSIRLTVQQLKVLAILTTETASEGSTVRALAKGLGVSLATMSGIVDRLESQSMIRRTADPGDLRVRRVLPTSEGREAIQRLLAARPQLNRQLLQRLALEDLRALNQGIAALLSASRENQQHLHVDGDERV